MSLISQQDREMVIEALEYYIEALQHNEENATSFQTLLNWIKLEKFKHE
jgi:hypothetical protein